MCYFLQLRNVSAAPADLESSDEHSRKFLNQVLERVAAAEHRNPKARQNILETSIQYVEFEIIHFH